MLGYLGENSTQIVPRMTLNEFHAGSLTRLSLYMGEAERLGHVRLNGGDATGDGQSSDGAGYRTGEAALLAGTGGAGGATADARNVGDANPLLGEHVGRVVYLAFWIELAPSPATAPVRICMPTVPNEPSVASAAASPLAPCSTNVD